MLLIKPFSFVLALLPLCANAASDKKLTETLDNAVAVASDTNTIAKSITFSNIFSTGPKIVNNHREIISILSSGIEAEVHSSQKRDVVISIKIDGPSARQKYLTPAAPNSDEDDLFSAYQSFAATLTEMLNSEIDKYKIMSLTPFPQPIAQTLRLIEGSADTISFGVIDQLPKRQTELRKLKYDLDAVLEKAVNTYSA